MRTRTAKRHLEMGCKNLGELQSDSLEACRGFGTCLERYVGELEEAGQRFFEGKEAMKIFCGAQTCRWNRGGRCTMEFNNDNPHSMDESGRCLDYAPR